MDISAGPIRIEVIEPLHKLRVTVDARDRGLAADIVFTGRNAPIEEPRFIRRIGPRTLMDYTRLTQNGRYQGWIELDGVRETVDGFVGTRDRSWGVRPVGLRDPQPLAPVVAPQFFWLWAPTNFETASLFFHTNDDAAGLPWNRRAVWAADGQPPREIEHAKMQIGWKSGTRHAASATRHARRRRRSLEATFTPIYNFFMLGLGYGHPKWAHGLNHGELCSRARGYRARDVDVRQPHHLHIQALCDVTAARRAAARIRAAACWSSWRWARTRRPASSRRWISRHERARRRSARQRLERYLATLWKRRRRVRDSRTHSRRRQPRDLSLRCRDRTASVGMILRRDPRQPDRYRQAHRIPRLQSFHGIVPVPEPLVLDTEGGRWSGRSSS
jgi:hypothetical protein